VRDTVLARAVVPQPNHVLESSGELAKAERWPYPRGLDLAATGGAGKVHCEQALR
jgi:hypothetical protein